MQDEQGEDLVVENVEEPQQQYNHNDDDPVEFDNDGGGFDAEDDASQEQLNSADPPTDDEDTPADDDQYDGLEEKLDTINNEDELNSLSSDHVDVDALLQNGRKKKTHSPMSTIKELRVESAQSKQSSQVSLESEDEEEKSTIDDNDLAGLDLLRKDSTDTLSPRSDDDVENSVSNHEKDDEEDNHSSPMQFDNHDGGFEDEDDDDVVSNGDIEEENETLARQSQSRRNEKVITGLNLDEEVKKESRKGPKKKIFPPGPLVSSQVSNCASSKWMY